MNPPLLIVLAAIVATAFTWPKEVPDVGSDPLPCPNTVRAWAPRFQGLSDDDLVQAVIEEAVFKSRLTGNPWTVLLAPRVYHMTNSVVLKRKVHFDGNGSFLSFSKLPTNKAYFIIESPQKR